MVPTRPRTDAALPDADDSDVEYLRRRAAAARSRIRSAWVQLGSALCSAANPRKLMRYHPVGTTVTVGVVAALATRRLMKTPEAQKPRGLLADAFRAIRSTLVQSIVSQTIVAALAVPTEPAEESDGQRTDAPA